MGGGWMEGGGVLYEGLDGGGGVLYEGWMGGGGGLLNSLFMSGIILHFPMSCTLPKKKN